jgi:hypothetical protein
MLRPQVFLNPWHENGPKILRSLLSYGELSLAVKVHSYNPHISTFRFDPAGRSRVHDLYVRAISSDEATFEESEMVRRVIEALTESEAPLKRVSQ